MNTTVLFICQGGDIEIQSMLLAASLREHLPTGTPMIACVPSAAQGWSQPERAAIDLLESLGCRTAEISNRLDPAYGLANKIACLEVPVDTGHRLFIDSDVLCLRAFDPGNLPASDFAAKPADLPTYGRDDDTWARSYAALGMKAPEATMTTTVSGEPTPPYFNSGVLSVRTSIPLADEWIACARAIHGIATPYFREQAGLALAVTRLGLTTMQLDESMNFPAHLKPVDPDHLPLLCHYHYPHIIRREPLLASRVRELAERHPALSRRMRRHAEWSRVLKPWPRRKGLRAWRSPPRPYPAQAALPLPDLVLTGIPRSGTSYLCRLLGRYRHCVIINEPREAVLTLQAPGLPWGLASLYRDVRRDILDGKAIKNKVAGREVQEDTAREDIRTPVHPMVYRSDFILGIKNTQSFLCRIGAIRAVMPTARIAACVRDPADTIGSWKRSFPHLRDGDVTGIPVGHVHDPSLSDEDRATLSAIAACTSVAERRARLWTFLAGLVIRHREHLQIIRYPDLVLAPLDHLAPLLRGREPGRLRKPILPSTLRHSAGALDAEDLDAIHAFCQPAAQELGLSTGPA